MADEIQSIALVSLGCPKNLVDSERMLGLLASDGLVVTSDAEEADAIVINTCGFLEASKVESMGEIHRAIRLKEKGKCRRVVVAGCLVQRHKTRLLAEAPGIDRLVGVFDRDHIVEAVRGTGNAGRDGHFLGKYHELSRRMEGNTASKLAGYTEDDRGRLRLTPRHYAFLRVSEGCNQGCAFCTIPSIRGPMRSKPIEHVLAEARELAADGAVELNLIGQDTTSYGTDIGYEPGLSGLIKTLDKEMKDVHWLRLMYAYPSCFTDEMIRALAQSDRMARYIDMPLQHVNDEMLTTMKRRVTRKQIETLLGKLREWVPGITIRTTFIAGSPGETDGQHRELVEFVREFGFDMMGVFAFSAEPGTAMGRMEGQIPEAVKKARVEELMLAQQEIAFAKARGRIGQKVEVLVDRTLRKKGQWTGRTSGQAPQIDSVTIVSGPELHAGKMVTAKVSGSRGYDLVAEVQAGRSLRVVEL
ncbi:MAG: 30S ribosomal protein S12 methylthiotransferase RimO [Tepidisphaeraceae bacterium]|jgi:ribosomal protein S12 methylthiotransferase